jgi:hypothetical protein
MATFAGRTSPAALSALAPSITNLAAAQRAKSQAAAGLMNTLGVQFEKQKEQEARKQKNQAAQQVAEGLLKDEAFRRQVPGISTSADLVKLVGAENVIEYGMKSQQADRLAQQSAAQIALTRKQIEQYDIEAKQREADLAAKKAEGEAFQQLVSAGGKLSDDQLGSILSGLNPDAQARAISLRNQLDPSNAYDIVDLPNGESALIYGNQIMRISTQEKSKLPEAYTQGLALINEQFEKGTPEYDRAVQNLTDRTLGYDVSLGETAFGGQPAAAGPFVPTEAEQALYSRMPDFFTEDNMVDSEKLEAELAKMDFLTPEEADRMRQYAAQESIARRRRAYGTVEEEEAEKSGGFFTRDPLEAFSIPESSPPARGGTGRVSPIAIAREMMVGGATQRSAPRVADFINEAVEAKSGDDRYSDLAEAFIGRGRNMGQRGGPSSRVLDQGRGVMEIVGSGRLAASQPPELGGPNVPMVRPSARVPAVVTGQPGPGIPGGMEATGRGRVAAAQQIGERVRLSEGPLARGVVEVLGPQIKAVGERIDETLRANRTLKEEQATFKRAKELAKQEILKTYKGKDRDQILKELEEARLNRIKQMPKTSAQTKAQQKMHEVLMEMLGMSEGPITSYGDRRMQPQPMLPVE